MPVAAAMNFRDLGGKRARDGRRIRAGRIFRTGNLANLGDPDAGQLRQIQQRPVRGFVRLNSSSAP